MSMFAGKFDKCNFLKQLVRTRYIPLALIVLLLADKEKASNINFQANTGTVLFPFQHFAEKQTKNTYLKKK